MQYKYLHFITISITQVFYTTQSNILIHIKNDNDKSFR